MCPIIPLIILLTVLSTFVYSPLPKDYPYYQIIEVNGKSVGDTTHILFSLNTQRLISQNLLDENCESIRFYSVDDDDYVPFWIENGCNITSTNIWISHPIISLSESVYDIHFMCGNFNASTNVDLISSTSSVIKFTGSFYSFSSSGCYGNLENALDFDNYFVLGHDSIDAFEAEKHTHEAFLSLNTSTRVSGYADVTDTSGGTATALPSHVHLFNTSVMIYLGYSGLPEYCTSYVCKVKDGLNYYPQEDQVVIFRNNSDYRLNFTKYFDPPPENFKGKFLLGNQSFGDCAGSNFHTHAVSGITYGAIGENMQAYLDTADEIVLAAHVHEFYGSVGEGNSIPPFVAVTLGITKQVDEEFRVNGNMMFMVDKIPPLGYRMLNDTLYGKYLRVATNESKNEVTGGYVTHSHPNNTFVSNVDTCPGCPILNWDPSGMDDYHILDLMNPHAHKVTIGAEAGGNEKMVNTKQLIMMERNEGIEIRDKCIPGWGSNTETCFPCPISTYFPSNVTNYMDQSCLGCPEGQYGSREGQISCIDCEPGYFTDSTGNSACQPCPLGTYNSEYGKTQCLLCTDGSVCPTGSVFPVVQSLVDERTLYSDFVYSLWKLSFTPKIIIFFLMMIMIFVLVVFLIVCSYIPGIKKCIHMKKFDFFYNLNHDIEEKENPFKESTNIGGIASVVALLIALCLILFSFIDFVTTNRMSRERIEFYFGSGDGTSFLGDYSFSSIIQASISNCTDTAVSLDGLTVGNGRIECVDRMKDIGDNNVVSVCECSYDCRDCQINDRSLFVEFDYLVDSSLVHLIEYQLGLPHYEDGESFLVEGRIFEANSTLENIDIDFSLFPTKKTSCSNWNLLLQFLNLDVYPEKNGVGGSLLSYRADTSYSATTNLKVKFNLQFSNFRYWVEEYHNQSILNIVSQFVGLFTLCVALFGFCHSKSESCHGCSSKNFKKVKKKVRKKLKNVDVLVDLSVASVELNELKLEKDGQVNMMEEKPNIVEMNNVQNDIEDFKEMGEENLMIEEVKRDDDNKVDVGGYNKEIEVPREIEKKQTIEREDKDTNEVEKLKKRLEEMEEKFAKFEKKFSENEVKGN